ncbi:MAG: ABC transporter permease [Lachnospiraceae bacterium]
MMGLLVFKEQLKAFYGKYDMYIKPVLKFCLSLSVFLVMNQNIGFMARLKSPAVVLALSLVCSFLPYGVITALAAGFMLAHVSVVSLEITLLLGVSMLIIALLYYSFQPGDSYLLLLTPLLFVFKIPYAIPLLVGLSGNIAGVIPVSCGVYLYYMLSYVKQNAGILTGDGSVDITQKYTQIVKGMMGNQLMLVMILAFAIGIFVVFILHNLSVDYAWMIAIIAGTIAQLAVVFVGDFVFDISVSVGQLILGIIASACIAGIYNFFVFAVDYTRTEYVQFEDDDYYYYVKAVPKIAVSKPDVKVKKINARRSQRPAERHSRGSGSPRNS